MLSTSNNKLYIIEHIINLMFNIICLCIFREDNLRIPFIITLWVNPQGRITTHWECIVTNILVIRVLAVDISKSVNTLVLASYILQQRVPLLPLSHLQNKGSFLIEYHFGVHFVDLNELFISCFLLLPGIGDVLRLFLWSYLVAEFLDAFVAHFPSVNGLLF